MKKWPGEEGRPTPRIMAAPGRGRVEKRGAKCWTQSRRASTVALRVAEDRGGLANRFPGRESDRLSWRYKLERATQCRHVGNIRTARRTLSEVLVHY